jgi:hypothetical protein
MDSMSSPQARVEPAGSVSGNATGEGLDLWPSGSTLGSVLASWTLTLLITASSRELVSTVLLSLTAAARSSVENTQSRPGRRTAALRAAVPRAAG